MIEEGENGKAVKLPDSLVKRAGAKMAHLGGETWIVRSRFDMECTEEIIAKGTEAFSASKLCRLVLERSKYV
jgi:hypothetical protein